MTVELPLDGGRSGRSEWDESPAPPAVDEPDAVLDEPAATGGDSVDGDSAAPVHTPPAADTPREEDRDLPDTPRSHTELGTVYGLIHTGDGDQHIYLSSAAFTIDDRGRLHHRVPLLVGEDQVAHLRKCFFAPDGYRDALQMLAERRTVIITGEAGSGRTTAAKILLATAGGGEIRLRELPEDDYDVGDGPTGMLLPERLSRGEQLLLDLSGPNRELLAPAQAVLEGYRNAVRAHDSYLVVVIDPDQRIELRDEFRDLIVPLGRPDGEQVLRRHLAAQGIAWEGEFPDQIKAWIPKARMGEIAELVRIAGEGRRSAPEAGPAEWLAQALDALTAYGAEVEKQVEGLDSWQRALLLTVAMFEGARSNVVAAAAGMLAEQVKTPEPEEPRLQRPTFTSRLKDIEARLEPDHSVRFGRVGYAAAVRNWFWDNYPELGRDLCVWIDQCVRLRGLTGRDRDQAVAHFTREMLRVGRIEELFVYITHWARGRLDLSAQIAYALSEALAHDGFSRKVRRQVLLWARNHNLSPRLARVLVTVSAQVIADAWPDEAMVRLHQLTRHTARKVQEEATEALLALVEQPQLCLRLMLRIADALSQRYRATDVELLERLAATEPGASLVDDPQVRPVLVQALATVCAQETVLVQYAYRWALATGAASSLVDLLVEAAERAGQGVVLYAAALRWAMGTQHGGSAERARRVRAARLVTRRIDELHEAWRQRPGQEEEA